MWTQYFAAGPVTDSECAKKADTKKVSRFIWEMMDPGYDLPCSHFEVAFPSVMHTQELVNETIAAAREPIAGVKSPGSPRSGLRLPITARTLQFGYSAAKTRL